MKANMKRPALEGTAETLGNLEDLRVLRAGQRSARQAQAPIDRAEPGDLIRVENAADGVGDMVILTRLAEDTDVLLRELVLLSERVERDANLVAVLDQTAVAEGDREAEDTRLHLETVLTLTDDLDLQDHLDGVTVLNL